MEPSLLPVTMQVSSGYGLAPVMVGVVPQEARTRAMAAPPMIFVNDVLFMMSLVSGLVYR